MLHKLLHVPSNVRYLRRRQLRRTDSGTLSQEGSTSMKASSPWRWRDDPTIGEKPNNKHVPTKITRLFGNLGKRHELLYVVSVRCVVDRQFSPESHVVWYTRSYEYETLKE